MNGKNMKFPKRQLNIFFLVVVVAILNLVDAVDKKDKHLHKTFDTSDEDISTLSKKSILHNSNIQYKEIYGHEKYTGDEKVVKDFSGTRSKAGHRLENSELHRKAETTGTKRNDVDDVTANDDSDLQNLNEYQQGDDNPQSDNENPNEAGPSAVSLTRMTEPVGYESTGYNFDEPSNKVSRFVEGKTSNQEDSDVEAYNDENVFLKGEVSPDANNQKDEEAALFDDEEKSTETSKSVSGAPADSGALVNSGTPVNSGKRLNPEVSANSETPVDSATPVNPEASANSEAPVISGAPVYPGTVSENAGTVFNTTEDQNNAASTPEAQSESRIASNAKDESKIKGKDDKGKVAVEEHVKQNKAVDTTNKVKELNKLLQENENNEQKDGKNVKNTIDMNSKQSNLTPEETNTGIDLMLTESKPGEPVKPVPADEGEDIMLEEVHRGDTTNLPQMNVQEIAATPSIKEELIDRFQAWGRNLLKRSPKYNYESKLARLKTEFYEWLRKTYSGQSKQTKTTSIEKVLEQFLEKIEKTSKEDKNEKPCVGCFSDEWLANLRFNALMLKEDVERQKILNQLYKNTSAVTQQSLNENIQWFTNITGINNTDSMLESIDLMSLNQGYHVRYPPNRLSFDVHQAHPANHHVDYHVYHYGDKVRHHFDHYYDNKSAVHSVNHYVSNMDPCMNGGIVVPLPDVQYQCICRKGYIGPKCEDFDYCSLKPCKNFGKCNPIDVTPRIHCTCSREWYGKLCEKRNPCYPNPCKNNGRCSHDSNGDFECVCKSGYRGEKCQFVDSCFPSPCINGGKCHSLKGVGEFYCECPQTHKGTICQHLTICPQQPCQNEGECRETADNDFQCVCKDGYFGKTCEQRPCSPNPCLNGATCVEDGKSYSCLCNPYTTGVNCSNISPCKLKPCSKNGRCIDAESGYKWSFKPMQYYCICKPPWMGPYCTDNMCNHCSPYAHCDNDSRCICDEGYTGDGFVCEENEKNPCNPNPCMNDGKCFDRGDGNFECQCVLPYQPPLCVETDPCKVDPCHNGRCIPVSDGSYQCDCVEGFSGPNCNVSDPCKPNPCQNHGTCVIEEKKKATCTCLGRWMQPICKECGCPKSSDPANIPDSYCDEFGACQCYHMNNMTWSFTGSKCVAMNSYTTKAPPSICNPNPCKNGGTCLDTGKGFKCQCSRWFMGNTCQYLKACIPRNPCWNGGTCVEDGKGGFKCKCPPGTMPPQCAPEPNSYSPQKHCEEQPCKNDGICTEALNGYDCHCKPRFTGPNCDIDRCQDCDDDAQCILGRCYCNEGFIGNGYECQVDDTNQCGDQKCSQHGYCIEDTCYCSPGYTMVNNICVYPQKQPAVKPRKPVIPITQSPTMFTLVPPLKTTAAPITTPSTAQPTTPKPTTASTTKRTTPMTESPTTLTLVPPLKTTTTRKTTTSTTRPTTPSTTEETTPSTPPTEPTTTTEATTTENTEPTTPPTQPMSPPTLVPSKSTTDSGGGPPGDRPPSPGGPPAVENLTSNDGPPGTRKSIEKLLEIHHAPAPDTVATSETSVRSDNDDSSEKTMREELRKYANINKELHKLAETKGHHSKKKTRIEFKTNDNNDSDDDEDDDGSSSLD